MLQIRPIIHALRRHKAGAILIGLQIALTLAVVCNALFIISSRIERISRPTGVAESELMYVLNRWVGDPAEFPARQAADLAALRSLPGVADAYATNAMPVSGDAWQSGVRIKPGTDYLGSVAVMFADDHALNTLGVRLYEGRNFRPDEIGSIDENGSPDAPTVMITRALAERLFPGQPATGKIIYLGNVDAKPSTIIGVIDRLQSPGTSVDESGSWNEVVMVPMHLAWSGAMFVIRARPGELHTLLKSAPAALKEISRRRIIAEPDGVSTFTDLRERAYSSDRGLAWMMGGICLVLLGVTAAGIVGLTSFWVGQRRKQIGVRRALGATRRDILTYFLTENALITIGGIVAGVVLAAILNGWMMVTFETARLAVGYVVVGAAVLLVLGQLAVLAPAMRASRVPPVEATRSI
ncbi:ABC transporter permease [Pinirhizobacter soli]|uniref:ABC transporter permease n=1 Tax=Pinirhizobacter soli TaxID=2786953 RepID=UPI00202A69C4|nr:FtsX-like permease family protein [Pinirhizobacter soli]